jgi:beta-N-acetylhexosaminidase
LKPVILGISGQRLLPEERELFRAHAPRGVILFARNIADPVQLAGLVGELREALPAGAVLMVDQEGGRVARLKAPHWPALPAAGTLRTEAEAFAHGRALGAMVKAAGFDVAAAPVLDLRHAGASDVVGDRAISGAPETVAALGGKIAEGILAESVTPVMKHLPGHGRALVDSHFALPRVEAGLEELAADFLPFLENRNLPWAMTAHVIYAQVDPELPATVSAKVIREIIRSKIGFAGVLVSDDLAMQALRGTPAERAAAALAAGCDIALYCSGEFAANRMVLEAVAHGRDTAWA